MKLWQLRLVNRALRLRLAGRNISSQGRANLRSMDGHRASAPAREQRYVVVDLETTGLDVNRDRVVSVGAYRVVNNRVRVGEVFSELVNPGRDIPPESIRVHAIVPDQVAGARVAWEVFDSFLEFLGNDILVAHHALFDLFFINWVMRNRHGIRLQNVVLDSVLMCRTAFIEPDPYGQRRGAKRCSLDALAERFGLQVPERHTALGDALATALIFQRLILELEKRGWKTLGDLVSVAAVR